MPEHVHRWKLGDPANGVVHGKCVKGRKCRAERDFPADGGIGPRMFDVAIAENGAKQSIMGRYVTRYGKRDR